MPGMNPAEEIARRLAQVRMAMAQAAREAGRDPASVTLIAVSKKQPCARIDAAARAGQRCFGESVVQEALRKFAACAQAQAEWHFLGHVQSNKAKYLPGHFAWLHSLDSLALAQRLDRFCKERGSALNALIEVNITRDPNKHGVPPERLLPLAEALLGAGLTRLRLRGLMAIGPYGASSSELRAAFACVRRLREDCVARFGLKDFDQLSMGMSEDFREAILEGATFIRVGSAIFGERA